MKRGEATAKALSSPHDAMDYRHAETYVEIEFSKANQSDGSRCEIRRSHPDIQRRSMRNCQPRSQFSIVGCIYDWSLRQDEEYYGTA